MAPTLLAEADLALNPLIQFVSGCCIRDSLGPLENYFPQETLSL